jgi:hypothetical protein
MLTQNCDEHPLLCLMHKPDPALPADQQDKRSVIPIERADWDTWLNGTVEEAMALVQLPPEDLFAHGAADPKQQVVLPRTSEFGSSRPSPQPSPASGRGSSEARDLPLPLPLAGEVGGEARGLSLPLPLAGEVGGEARGLSLPLPLAGEVGDEARGLSLPLPLAGEGGGEGS